MDIDTIDYNVQTVVTYGNSRCTCTYTKKERGEDRERGKREKVAGRQAHR